MIAEPPPPDTTKELHALTKRLHECLTAELLLRQAYAGQIISPKDLKELIGRTVSNVAQRDPEEESLYNYRYPVKNFHDENAKTETEKDLSRAGRGRYFSPINESQRPPSKYKSFKLWCCCREKPDANPHQTDNEKIADCLKEIRSSRPENWLKIFVDALMHPITCCKWQEGHFNGEAPIAEAVADNMSITRLAPGILLTRTLTELMVLHLVQYYGFTLLPFHALSEMIKTTTGSKSMPTPQFGSTSGLEQGKVMCISMINPFEAAVTTVKLFDKEGEVYTLFCDVSYKIGVNGSIAPTKVSAKYLKGDHTQKSVKELRELCNTTRNRRHETPWARDPRMQKTFRKAETEVWYACAIASLCFSRSKRDSQSKGTVELNELRNIFEKLDGNKFDEMQETFSPATWKEICSGPVYELVQALKGHATPPQPSALKRKVSAEAYKLYKTCYEQFEGVKPRRLDLGGGGSPAAKLSIT